MTAVPRVSVLVAAFNGEAFLEEALASLRGQTFRDFEAIVVDDGSTDGTAALVAKAASADPRFRLLRQANAGTQAARNAALADARGTWVGLLDQDDVWLPGKLEAQIVLADADPRANLLFTNYLMWDGTRTTGTRYTRPGKVPEGDVAVGLCRGCLFQASTVMVPRLLALSLGGFDTELRNAGDWDLWLRIAERGIHARGSSTPLVLYREWSGNESLNHVRTAEEGVRVIEKALDRPQAPPLRAACARSLGRARAQVELARARARLDDPTFVRARLRAAFSADRTAKRLLEWLAVAWPSSFGGRRTASIVHAKLARKFR
jgi:glycosyltransferase involved in cell wall biosynthesis